MEATQRPRPWIFRRLLAMVYDAFPVVAICMLIGAAFVAGVSIVRHDARAYIAPWSLLNWIEWALCWLATGAYAIASWRRGGQTLGMRPWRLRVVAADDGRPAVKALAIRYAVGTVSLLAAGLGFWWAWIDRDRLAWHDRASGTRMRREAKR